MRITLADVFAAARESACPIIHISMLAGEAPFIASSPCLGNASVPLIDITVDGYLGLMAELRNTLAVEHDECLSFPIFTGGGRDPHAFAKRLELPPRTTSGSLDLACGHAAVYYLMDSVGQETTILYDGLRSFADIQSYWQRRGELWRTFVELYNPIDDDLEELSYLLDHTVLLDDFDVHALAARRGLVQRSERIAS
jgi:hypothetical protein